MAKRVVSILFMVLVLGLLIWLLIQAGKEEMLTVGSHLPGLEYKDINGMEQLAYRGKPIIVVYFSTKCEHCQYELQLFEGHISEFVEVEIYFFTSEKQFFAEKLNIEWKNLIKAGNVRFGIVSKNNFEKNFSLTVSPSLFFFSKKGKLKEKIRGEIKLDRILEITKSLTSGRAQSSGNN